MTSHEVLESVAKSMVTAGLYKDEGAAILALALEQIEKKIAAYQEQMQAFAHKYHHSLEEYGRLLEGKASMEEEEEWMEWKGAAVMLEAWQNALKEVLGGALSAGH
jgi:hypothetical protein